MISAAKPQLSSLCDGDVRMSRHRIWPSRYLYDCTNKMVLSTKKRFGWQNTGPHGGPKSIILKGLDCNLLPMQIRARHIATIVALSLAGFALSGCDTINERLAGSVSD